MSKGNILSISKDNGFWASYSYDTLHTVSKEVIDENFCDGYMETVFVDNGKEFLDIFENSCSPALVDLIKSNNFAFESILHLIKGDPTFDTEGRYCLPREISNV